MKPHLEINLPSLADTLYLGRLLGEGAAGGDVLTLAGELGAGKTTLTQAIGQGLQVPSACYITSPTFGLLHEYPGRLPLYHMDLYRLADEDEVVQLGFEDYIYGAGVTVVEWPDRLGSLLPGERLHVEIRFKGVDAAAGKSPGRVAFLTAYGNQWQDRVALLRAKY